MNEPRGLYYSIGTTRIVEKDKVLWFHRSDNVWRVATRTYYIPGVIQVPIEFC